MIQLPIPHPDGHRTAEIKRPTSKVLSAVHDEPGGVWSKIVLLLKRCLVKLGDNPPTQESIEAIPVKSAELLLKEIILTIDSDPRMQGSWPCNNPGCTGFAYRFYDDKNDNRISIHEFNCNHSNGENYEGLHFVYKLTEPQPLVWNDTQQGPVTEATITAHVYRNLLIRDLLKIESKKSLGGKEAAAAEEILFMCLVDVHGDVEGLKTEGPLITDKREGILQTRYEDEIIDFPYPYDRDGALLGLNRYGIDPTIKMRCTACGNVWNQAVMFTSFFDLLQTAGR